MNQMEIFKNPEFGSIRVIEENGKYLFCGLDMAKALGYSNSRKALIDHCKGVTKRDTLTVGGTQQLSFIPEGDVYRLIVHSKLPSAERFERWVFDEVLPSIRKHRAYMTKEKLWEVATSPEALLKLCSDLLAEREENAALREENALLESKAAFYDAILDGIDQSSINQALANEYASHIAANEQQVEQALEFKARLYESLITGTISKEEYTDYKARYARIAENAKESIRVLKEKLADVLENRSERNRWISHFTQFSTMETLDRKAVVHMIQSIRVIGKKELEITFTYQDEYQKAIQLIQLAEQTSQRKVG